MKIALLCSNSGSGGLIKYIEGFLKTETSHNVRLFCGPTLPIPETEIVQIIRTPYAAESGLDLLLNRPLLPQLIQMVDDFAPDAVIFMNGFMRRGLEKYPCLSILHNQLAINQKLLFQQRPLRLVASLLAVRKAVLFSLRAADGMIFLSNASKTETDQYRHLYKDGRVILFGQERADQLNGNRKQNNELIYVSTQFPYKNHKRLLEALGKIKNMGKKFHISFIGCKETAALKEMVKTLRLEDHVTFYGWLSHDKTMEMIKQADVYIHPSLIESTSNGVLEGIGENATIVCSRLDVFTEALGEHAYYFDPLNVDDMANAIAKAMENPKLLSLDMCRNILAPYDYRKGVNDVYEYAAELAHWKSNRPSKKETAQ